MILTPYGFVPGQYPSEIVGSIGGDGRYLCPPDQMYYSQGEEGYYHDSPLGGGDSGPQVMAQGPTPSDFETARAYQYTPAVRNWVATKEGYIQGPYYPQPPGGHIYPMSPAPISFGDASSVAQQAASMSTGQLVYKTAEQIADEKRKKITFWLSVITTAIVGTGAAFSLYRAAKGLNHDRFIRDALHKRVL